VVHIGDPYWCVYVALFGSTNKFTDAVLMFPTVRNFQYSRSIFILTIIWNQSEHSKKLHISHNERNDQLTFM
jgi:hypothetical protein